MLRELSRTDGIGIKAAGSTPVLFSAGALFDPALTYVMNALN